MTSFRNVKETRFGHGTVSGLGREFPSFIAVSMEVPWNIVGPQLGREPDQLIMVKDMTQESVDRALAEAGSYDAVLAIGGGQAIDMGKYIAWKKGMKMVSVPTIISTNAFVTPSIGVRTGESVVYVGDVTHDLLVVDFDIIGAAPFELNIVGTGDILSGHTGSFDWEVASRAGVTERNYPFEPERVARMRKIIQTIEANADEIAQMTPVGIQTVVESYLGINEICLPVGHFRAEEGSEHFFAYNVERVTGRTFVHGKLVALGVDIISRLQENEHERITGLMDRLGLPHSPKANGLSNEEVVEALRTLPEFVKEKKYWYSIVDEKGIDAEFIESVVEDLEF